MSFYTKNPHCSQWPLLHDTKIPPVGTLNRVLDLQSGTRDYQPLPGLNKSTCHWGQRKLFLTELEFFSLFLNESQEGTVIYVGSAPGTHLFYLSELFPKLKFILYDPRDFDKKLYQNTQFTIFQKFFSDTDATRYKGLSYFLVSDIRTADLQYDPEHVIERKIALDMRNQERWYQLMEPEKALFKFRLPFLNPGNPVLANGRTTFEYLDGEIRIQPFPRQMTSETRLIPNGGRKEWNIKDYESAMFTFNIEGRVKQYPYSPEIPGLDFCADCAFEVEIWKMYIEATKSRKTVAQLSNELNNNLSGGRFTPLTYPLKNKDLE